MNGCGVGHEHSHIPTIGWSDFATKSISRLAGNSYTILTPDLLVRLIQAHWSNRRPGDGEGDCRDRKVLVPVPTILTDADRDKWIDFPLNTPLFYCPLKVALYEGMPIKSQVSVRSGQENTNEKPHVETWISAVDAEASDKLVETPASLVEVVCYSADALLENGGNRSTDCEFEIVTVLATTGNIEPMHPLTMARNFLGMEGGTKSVYTAEEFAKAIWFHSAKGIKVKG